MDDTIRLSRLEKYCAPPSVPTSPPLYTIEANGANFRVTSGALNSPQKFFQTVREEIDVVVDPPPQGVWNKHLRVLLAGESVEFKIDFYAKE